MVGMAVVERGAEPCTPSLSATVDVNEFGVPL